MESLKEDLQELKKGIHDIMEMLRPADDADDDEAEETLGVELDEAICADFFKALSNEERLKIMSALSKEEMYFAQMKEITGLDHSPLRFHLTVLKDVNLIGQERFRGKYSITELGAQTLRIASSFNRLFTKERMEYG